MIPQHLQETVSSAPPQFVCIDCAPTQSHAENRQPNPFSLHAQRVQAANNELQQNLRDKGIEPRRHTINDFEHVILTQLNLQLEGQNLTPTEVLRAAFPADSGKAESIGKSAYHQLWRRAYASPRIAGHTVVLHMLKVIGQRDMNLRSGARTFAHSLSLSPWAQVVVHIVELHSKKLCDFCSPPSFCPQCPNGRALGRWGSLS